MGKTEQSALVVIADPRRRAPAGRTIFCPCLAGLPAEMALTLGILPVHDANQRLLDALDDLDRTCLPDFAGLYLADPFRRLDDMLDRIEAAGIAGVVNLPNVVPLLGGAPPSAMTGLHRTERLALDIAAARGFDTLFVTTPGAAAAAGGITLDRLELIGF